MKVRATLARNGETVDVTVDTAGVFVPNKQSMQLVLCLLGWHGWTMVTEPKGDETT